MITCSPLQVHATYAHAHELLSDSPDFALVKSTFKSTFLLQKTAIKCQFPLRIPHTTGSKLVLRFWKPERAAGGQISAAMQPI